MSTKYLVIGAPGWLGTRFVRALCGTIPQLKNYAVINEADEIRCLVLPGLDKSILTSIHPKVRAVEGDITDPKSLEAFFENTQGAIVFHLAGIIHPNKGIRQLFQINFEGANNVLQKSIEHRVKRFIAVSSNSPAGNNPTHEHLFTENMPYNPYMAYGKSKMEMERVVQAAFRRGDLETVIIRPCWFYGPDQPSRQTLFFTMIKEGKFPLLGKGLNKRSMSYVDNLCEGILRASVSAKAVGQIYWIADERPYTMAEIIDTIERLLEKEFNIPVAHKRMNLPEITGDVAMVIDGALQSAGIYQQKIHVLSEMNKTIACSVQKAKRELGYSPSVSLEEGMRRSIRWCIETGIKI